MLRGPAQGGELVRAAHPPMLPLFFGPSSRPLFGALHPSARPRSRAAGVVLVSPFGSEELHAHRAERHLAERLAAAGFPALRFDLDGTGDSAGDDREGGRVAAWRESIAAAVREVRARCGVERVVLAGMRAGALLSLAVAAEVGADRLVLWNPVLSGKAHLRELTRLHKMLFPKGKDGRDPKDSPPPDMDEALGYVVRKDTLADLGKLDATSLSERPAAACLVIGGGDSPAEDKLLEALRSAGVEVEYKHLPGHPFLVADPHRSEVPGEMLDAIVGYLSAAYPLASHREDEREAGPTAAPEPPRPTAVAGPAGEEALLFGGLKYRFGILTLPAPAESQSKGGAGAPADLPATSVQPASPAPNRDKPAIVLLNAGSVHRVGPNRSFVRMARRWAALGYPVLRMDMSGIGDSPHAEGCPENLPYPRDAVLDAQAAMNALSERGIASRFILAGLCSGADIAFRTAVLDSRVCGAWMINPQAFYFESSDTLKAFMHAELEAKYYRSGLFDAARWKKLLSGKVNLRYVAKIFRGKAESVIKKQMARLLGDAGGAADKAPEARDVIRDLRAIAGRGADALLLCSEDDPGLEYLVQYFGDELAALDGLPGYRKVIVKGTDHTFTPLWSQDMLSDVLTEHLRNGHS